jgi:hypothetical protein
MRMRGVKCSSLQAGFAACAPCKKAVDVNWGVTSGKQSSRAAAWHAASRPESTGAQSAAAHTGRRQSQDSFNRGIAQHLRARQGRPPELSSSWCEDRSS